MLASCVVPERNPERNAHGREQFSSAGAVAMDLAGKLKAT